MKELKIHTSCIVIPFHKAQMDANQRASFKQALKVFCKQPIYLLLPEKTPICQFDACGENFEIVFIDSKWFTNLHTYNKLKCSSYFYELFENHSHILTYELDAWVFEDQLDYWSSLPYDYIGAPWQSRASSRHETAREPVVGNSGFSLRKTSSCRRIARIRERLDSLVRMIGYRGRNIFLRIPFLKKHGPFTCDNLIAEDTFWSTCVTKSFTNFSIAPYDLARKFSFEMYPSELYTENNRKLPFGCHAWHKYDPLFWEKFIRIEDSSESR